MLIEVGKECNLLVNTVEHVLVLRDFVSPDSSKFFSLTLVFLCHLNSDGIHLGLEIFFSNFSGLLTHVDNVLIQTVGDVRATLAGGLD